MAIDYDLAVPSSWKPWAPKLGQRVRIRVSEECTALRAAANEKETLTRYHSRSETGMTGKVVRPTPGVWMPREGVPGHDVMVDFSPRSVHFQGCISFAALYFAAEELEPAPDERDLASATNADRNETTEPDLPQVSLPFIGEAVRPIKKPNRTRRQRRDARRRVHLPGR